MVGVTITVKIKLFCMLK